MRASARRSRAAQLVGALDFATAAGAELVVKVAISPVSEENAIANLEAEAQGWTSMRARAAARAAWEQRAVGRSPSRAARHMRRSFYTALYHALQAPSLFMDSDGRYRGPDNAVHQARRLHQLFDLLVVGHCTGHCTRC